MAASLAQDGRVAEVVVQHQGRQSDAGRVIGCVLEQLHRRILHGKVVGHGERGVAQRLRSLGECGSLCCCA
jgi:hypothetical protein